MPILTDEQTKEIISGAMEQIRAGVIEEAKNKLVVPNSALRFTPQLNPEEMEKRKPPSNQAIRMNNVSRVWIIDENGKQKCHERLVWPHSETLRQFLVRMYGKCKKLIISMEKQRPGEFCRPYTIHT